MYIFVTEYFINCTFLHCYYWQCIVFFNRVEKFSTGLFE